ncbi:MAG: VWA domain-containing protein [Vicinamibacterales bacterium]
MARVRPTVRAAGLLAAAIVGLQAIAVSPRLAAQQPVFRANTRLVVETVTVTRKDGTPIEGLTPNDFLVTEDGVPQTVAFAEFQRIDAAAPPATSAPASAAPPARPDAPPPAIQGGIARSQPGDIRYRDRRLLVLYFDLSAMPPADQMRAYTNALQYLDTQMTPLDLVALMAFQNGAVRVRQDFTDNRAALREQIQRLIYGDDLDGDGIPDISDPGTAFGQNDAEFNIFNTDRQLAALQTAVDMLRPLAEQKALIYFSSGLRLNGADNQAQLRATVNAALRANVTLNPIDARGLVATAPLGDATQRSPGGIGAFTGQFATAMATNFQKSQDTLYALAKDTGGAAMFDYNDLALGIAQAADGIKSYYILGYYATNLKTDGKFRRVKVTLRAGLEGVVRHRQGYFADKTFERMSAADKERQLEDALMLENPITDIPIALEVNYFQLNRAEYFVPVAVKIPGSELALAKKGGAQRTLLDVIGEVKDAYGNTIQNVRDKLDIPLSGDSATRLASQPIQYETGFTLLPDRYVIKLLVRDSTTGRIGTYQTAFTVPNLNKEETRLPISSVVLSGQRVPLAQALTQVKQKVDAEAVNPLVSGGQKLLPSVTRVFSRSRDLMVYLQAYERDTETMRPLVAFVSFYVDGMKVMETAPLPVTEGMHPRSKAVPLHASVPISRLEPGRYDVQVSVLDPGGSKVAFWRAPIVVRP